MARRKLHVCQLKCRGPRTNVSKHPISGLSCGNISRLLYDVIFWRRMEVIYFKTFPARLEPYMSHLCSGNGKFCSVLTRPKTVISQSPLNICTCNMLARKYLKILNYFYWDWWVKTITSDLSVIIINLSHVWKSAYKFFIFSLTSQTIPGQYKEGRG